MDSYKPILPSLKAEDIERFIGISQYISRSKGIGGVIKSRPEDFVIWEILETGMDAKKLFELSSFIKGYGGHLLCVMKKVKLDSIRAVSLLAARLNLKSREIGICGIKDKMSISWQFISMPSHVLENLEDTDVLKINNLLEVKPIKYVRHKLSSRFLKSNVFQVKIRHPRTTDLPIIEEIIRELKIKGIPNYYGHQRFGITRPITPIVGSLILRRMLREAVAAFLSDYSNLENEKNKLARKDLGERWDLEWARKNFPKSLTYERMMIESLLRHPEDYVKCLRILPLRLRRLIVESVAARIFNLTLSKIIEEGRFNELEVGDIVLPIDASGRADKNRPITVTNSNIKQIEKLIRDKKMAIALPTPGYLSPIPRNSKGEIMLKIMEEESLDFKDFKLVDLPEASTKGSLRPIAITSWDCSVTSIDNDSIILQFSLPPGSYATILLRELMKQTDPLAYVGRHYELYSD
jgi:tRNA pseudouridine13 synthase